MIEERKTITELESMTYKERLEDLHRTYLKNIGAGRARQVRVHEEENHKELNNVRCQPEKEERNEII